MTSSSSISLRPFLKSSSMVSICVPAFLRWELHQAVNVWETSMIHINIQLVIQPHIHTMSMSYLLLAQHLNPTLNFHQMRTLAQNIVTKLNVWDSSRFKSLQDCSDTMKASYTTFRSNPHCMGNFRRLCQQNLYFLVSTPREEVVGFIQTLYEKHGGKDMTVYSRDSAMVQTPVLYLNQLTLKDILTMNRKCNQISQRDNRMALAL